MDKTQVIAATVTQGDMVHTEFGDYGNYVDVIVDSVERLDDEWADWLVHYPRTPDRKFIMCVAEPYKELVEVYTQCRFY